MTTKGVILEQADRSFTHIEPHGGGANAAIKAETAAEKTFWQKSSPWVHGVLGVASFVPGLSVITGAIDAAIYTAEGDYVEAGIAAASMIPGGKVVTTAGKVAKRAVSAARVAKGAREAEEALKAAKAAKEAQENAKVAKDVNAATAASGGSGGKRGGKDTTIKGRKKGPCDHLRQGSGKGPYRGGAHGKTSRPRNDGKDSHHMPAKSISPLKSNEGPAIQMDPADHKNTSSYGPFKESDSYREKTKKLLQKKQWRKAMSMEIRDIRGIAKDSGEQRKYNEAMLEMLEYFKCLEKNGLLP
ncbi:hypothetical protein [Herbaspirillum huttiense]|uniref:hypothetical protein n=1 Tax=Herbaspirillum huttiense TaxID=863372 RepID=UPI001FB09F26|nr:MULTISPECIES: hypothetical protein [Herbaspirillum]UWE17019.1 hypothetical protein NY669_02255 [Herbaspirillum huttiense]